jgi:hypothetical protein
MPEWMSSVPAQSHTRRCDPCRVDVDLSVSQLVSSSLCPLRVAFCVCRLVASPLGPHIPFATRVSTSVALTRTRTDRLPLRRRCRLSRMRVTAEGSVGTVTVPLSSSEIIVGISAPSVMISRTPIITLIGFNQPPPRHLSTRRYKTSTKMGRSAGKTLQPGFQKLKTCED